LQNNGLRDRRRGCVLANRLIKDPAARVLVIEAGVRDRSP
jgi:hypothetical protein